jgi:hypothetical protein
MEEEWISKSLPRLGSNGSPNPTGGCKQTILLKRGRINRGGLIGEATYLEKRRGFWGYIDGTKK